MDPNVLTELVPQLVTLLKTGVGLGTKVDLMCKICSSVHYVHI